MSVTIHKAEGATKVYREYMGLSSDSKPTPSDLLTNSLFLELDTGDFYYYNGSAWEEIGA